MFLDKNIYKIEKLVGNFIKNIILIITNDNNLNVNIAIKKNFFDKSVKQKYLESILTEIKDLFLENYQDQMIMHMIVDNYIVNDQKYSKFENNLLSNNLGLEVNFVSISKDLVFLIDKILENYQIKISQYMSGTYVKNFFNDDKSDISIMAHRLKNGYNENEVVLVPKNIENKGFFEKFFQLFS
jgi:cell division ATPase FtsA